MNDLLSKQLSELGIPSLKQWAEESKNSAAQLRRLRECHLMDKMHGGFVLDQNEITEYLEGPIFRPQRPQTVNEFIKKYHWHVPPYYHPDRDGLSDQALQELMHSLRRRGLQNDDWPVLARGKIFQGLSKQKLKEIPIGYLDAFGLIMSHPILANIPAYVFEIDLTQNPKFHWTQITLGYAIKKLDPQTVIDYGGKELIKLLRNLRAAGFNKFDGRMTCLSNKTLERLHKISKKHRH